MKPFSNKHTTTQSKTTNAQEQTTPMLKNLRTKFIALNMITVAVLIVVAFTTICIVSWRQETLAVNTALDEAIEEAASAQNATPSLMGGHEFPFIPNGNDNDDEEETEGLVSPQIGGDPEDDMFIPLAVFIINEDGTLTGISAIATAYLSEETLQEVADEAEGLATGHGTLKSAGLMYAKQTINNITYVAFADTSSASSWQTLALTLLAIGIVVLALFLAINLFFSRWALRPVENAWQTQRQFVADASHELKTPLTVILANSSIIMEHPTATVASQSQWIESTQEEAARMKELVQDMLDLAKLDAQVPTEHTALNFSTLVESSLLQFESLAYEHHVAIDSTVAENITITGNKTRLTQLLGTLLDNACKYAASANNASNLLLGTSAESTPDANAGGCIRVSLTKQGKWAILTVNNNGSLIPAEDLPHVFDRFWRADKARVGDDGSYGLGLAIAHGIAEEHGGTITAASNSEQGTTFTVRLPLA